MAVNDEVLMTYADGELHDLGRARVERALAQEPALMARLEDHRRLRARFAAYYEPIVHEAVPERLTSLLGREGAGKVVDMGLARKPRLSWLRQNYMAIAATLVAGMVAGQLLPRDAGGPVSFEDGAMIAQGGIARALDTQLASTQSPDSPIRVGVSFQGEGGRACRTFDAPAMAGVACRGDERWQVLVTAPGASRSSTGHYRQAGSTDAVVMQAAQDMMTGEPFDAAAERRARDAGWTLDAGRAAGGDVGGTARRP